jgi:hypothetical protein
VCTTKTNKPNRIFTLVKIKTKLTSISSTSTLELQVHGQTLCLNLNQTLKLCPNQHLSSWYNGTNKITLILCILFRQTSLTKIPTPALFWNLPHFANKTIYLYDLWIHFHFFLKKKTMFSRFDLFTFLYLPLCSKILLLISLCHSPLKTISLLGYFILLYKIVLDPKFKVSMGGKIPH